MSLVVYSSSSEDEVFVINSTHEKLFLREYFEDAGRDPEDFDREEIGDVVEITVRAHVSGDRFITD